MLSDGATPPIPPSWRAAQDCVGPAPITFYIVDHPVFRRRGDIYPVPQTRKSTLQCYALWSQAVARLIDRLQPDLFHCPDFHAAMAVMYVERPLPIAIMLHNAEYQGWAPSPARPRARPASHTAVQAAWATNHSKAPL